MLPASSQDEFDHLTGLTDAVVQHVQDAQTVDLEGEHLRLARRCVLDGLAVSIGGSEQSGMEPLRAYIGVQASQGKARLLGVKGAATSPALAALWLGTAGHAMDWDDTQLAEGPGRPYGLLMHPTMPPLAASLSLAQQVSTESGVPVGGTQFLSAFTTGFEVGCKIAEAINPNHYMRGCHTSGTIGVFAAAASASVMLRLNPAQTANAIGIAASMSAGVRANFGSMTKPLHVGRAAENGVNAALLAREGFSANDQALDGRWGFLAVAGPGGEPELVRDRFGSPPSIVSPGISIKPYPSGVLTHPGMDALAFLMRDEGLSAEDIEQITLRAGSNVLGPIRFERAQTELEGKFCFNFLLAAIALRGQAGKAEFTDSFVQSAQCQEMQGRVQTLFDQEIEDMGWDRIRSRVDLRCKDGREFTKWADEAYRGSPHNPITDKQLEDKFRNCAAGLLDDAQSAAVFKAVWSIEALNDVSVLFDLLEWKAP